MSLFMSTAQTVASTLCLCVVFVNYDKNIMEYKAIDLGLPSGRLWSDRNVGAEKETDYGLYFQWGETVGYTDASHSTWETCPGNGGDSSYNAKSIDAWDADSLLDGILKPEVDSVTVNMGSKWRMPTIKNCLELVENTNYEDAEIDGVKGGKFISKADPSKYIFLPFAGAVVGGYFIYQRTFSYVWSSSVCLGSPARAYFIVTSESDYGSLADCRHSSMSVRGVC